MKQPFVYCLTLSILGSIAAFSFLSGSSELSLLLATLLHSLLIAAFVISIRAIENFTGSHKDLKGALERQELEHMVNSVVANIPNMVFVKDMQNDLRYTLLNKAGERMFGASEQEVIGKNDYDFFPKEQADFFRSKDFEVFSTGAGVKIANETIETPYGLRRLRTHKVPIVDEAGMPTLLIGISEDITDELKLKDQLEMERSKALLNAKLASLGEMSAGIAHEINNPLAIIDGNLQLIKMLKDQPEKLDAKLLIIESSVARITKIVGGLKKFSRTSTGYIRSPENLRNLLEEAISLTENKARRHGVEVRQSIQTDGFIECDVVEIEQVLINLINNAVDAVKMLPSRYVEISAFEFGDELRIQVIDSGPGISKEVEEKLFQPFFTTKPVGEGTGLGLSISKGILDQHLAKIRVNRDFKNTCFQIDFKKFQGIKNVA